MIKIVQKSKGLGYQHSFWYDGLIATCGKYQLIVTGDVTMRFVLDEPLVQDDRARREARRRGITDKDLMDHHNLDFIHNNWFEMIYQGEDDLPQQVALGSYREAMAAFKKVVEQGTYRPARVRR